MKKIIILLGFMFALSGAYSQDNILGYDQTWVKRDSTSNYEQSTASDSVIDYEVFKRTDKYVKTTVEQGYDSISGTASTVNIYLQAKMFDVDNYANIDTIIWSVTTSDTSIVFDVSTARKEEYYKTVAVPDDGSFIYGLDYTRVKFQY